jgi:hypothetical protein
MPPEAIVPVVFFIAFAAVAIFTARYRHLERMESIRTGVPIPPAIHDKGSLLVGLILLAFGIALALAEPFEDDPGMFVGALIVGFLSGAFLLFYYLTAPDRKRVQDYFDAQKTQCKSDSDLPPAP